MKQAWWGKKLQRCLSHLDFLLFSPPVLLLHYSVTADRLRACSCSPPLFSPFKLYCFDTNQPPIVLQKVAAAENQSFPRVAECVRRWADVAAPSPPHFHANQCKVTWTAIIYMFPQGLSPPLPHARAARPIIHPACAHNLCCIIFCFIS